MTKKILFFAFIVLALIQFYVPVKMIFDTEKILDTGKEYKFKTVPIDTSDHFRGKYIILPYDNNIVEVEDTTWEINMSIYVFLETDEEGFTKINSISKQKPTEKQDFFKAKVRSIDADSIKLKLTLDYPFNRYYIGEFKASKVKSFYKEIQKDTSKVTFAIVSIKHGQSILKDVLIDGISIKDIVKKE